MDTYRNPNEARKFLQQVRKTMENIMRHNVVSITTASTTKSRVKVINLKDVGVPNDGKALPVREGKYNISHSKDALNVKVSSMQDGEFQHLVKLDKEYRQSTSLYRELKSKAVEWNTLWSDNPHLGKLQEELELTVSVIQEALVVMRRKMSETSKQYCPTKVLSTVSGIESYIKSLPAKRLAKSIEVQFPEDTNPLLIQYRFAYKLFDLKTHSTRVLSSYILAITYVVDVAKGSAMGHITTMMEFDPNADIGGSFRTSEDGIDLINTLLDLDRVDLDVNVMPFPAIPGLDKDSLGLSTIQSLDVDSDLDRLFVRTNEFLNNEDQDEILHTVLTYIPDHLKHGQLRVEIGVEAYVIVNPISDRHKRSELHNLLLSTFDNVSIRTVGVGSSSPLEIYIKTNSFKWANKNLPPLKRFLIKNGATPKSSGIRNVFSFAIGAGNRTDIRALRKFIDAIGDQSGLDPKTIMKVRHAVGI